MKDPDTDESTTGVAVLGRDVLGRDVDDAENRVRGQVAGRAGAAAALADRMCVLTATATGADRAIRVTVGSSGVVTGLELDERVQRMTGVQLSEEILRVMRRAQAGLVDEVARAVDETVGAGTETGRAVLNSYARRFPAEPEAPPTSPVMPAPPPLPSFPNLPHQALGGSRGVRVR